jgi:hypothetical protein
MKFALSLVSVALAGALSTSAFAQSHGVEGCAPGATTHKVAGVEWTAYACGDHAVVLERTEQSGADMRTPHILMTPQGGGVHVIGGGEENSAARDELARWTAGQLRALYDQARSGAKR